MWNAKNHHAKHTSMLTRLWKCLQGICTASDDAVSSIKGSIQKRASLLSATICEGGHGQYLDRVELIHYTKASLSLTMRCKFDDALLQSWCSSLLLVLLKLNCAITAKHVDMGVVVQSISLLLVWMKRRGDRNFTSFLQDTVASCINLKGETSPRALTCLVVATLFCPRLKASMFCKLHLEYSLLSRNTLEHIVFHIKQGCRRGWLEEGDWLEVGYDSQCWEVLYVVAEELAHCLKNVGTQEFSFGVLKVTRSFPFEQMCKVAHEALSASPPAHLCNKEWLRSFVEFVYHVLYSTQTSMHKFMPSCTVVNELRCNEIGMHSLATRMLDLTCAYIIARSFVNSLNNACGGGLAPRDTSTEEVYEIVLCYLAFASLDRVQRVPAAEVVSKMALHTSSISKFSMGALKAINHISKARSVHLFYTDKFVSAIKKIFSRSFYIRFLRRQMQRDGIERLMLDLQQACELHENFMVEARLQISPFSEAGSFMLSSLVYSMHMILPNTCERSSVCLRYLHLSILKPILLQNEIVLDSLSLCAELLACWQYDHTPSVERNRRKILSIAVSAMQTIPSQEIVERIAIFELVDLTEMRSRLHVLPTLDRPKKDAFENCWIQFDAACACFTQPALSSSVSNEVSGSYDVALCYRHCQWMMNYQARNKCDGSCALYFKKFQRMSVLAKDFHSSQEQSMLEINLLSNLELFICALCASFYSRSSFQLVRVRTIAEGVCNEEQNLLAFLNSMRRGNARLRFHNCSSGYMMEDIFVTTTGIKLFAKSIIDCAFSTSQQFALFLLTWLVAWRRDVGEEDPGIFVLGSANVTMHACLHVAFRSCTLRPQAEIFPFLALSKSIYDEEGPVFSESSCFHFFDMTSGNNAKDSQRCSQLGFNYHVEIDNGENGPVIALYRISRNL